MVLRLTFLVEEKQEQFLKQDKVTTSFMVGLVMISFLVEMAMMSSMVTLGMTTFMLETDQTLLMVVMVLIHLLLKVMAFFVRESLLISILALEKELMPKEISIRASRTYMEPFTMIF